MKKLLTLAALCLTLISTPGWAIDLQTAKNNGLVGETPSGYLAAVSSPDGATASLIKKINDLRKKEYEKIAKQRSTSLKAVEQLAGKTAIDKTSSGHYVKVNGKWVKKP